MAKDRFGAASCAYLNFPDVHCKTDNAARQGGADYFRVPLSFGTPAFTVDLSPYNAYSTVRRLAPMLACDL